MSQPDPAILVKEKSQCQQNYVVSDKTLLGSESHITELTESKVGDMKDEGSGEMNVTVSRGTMTETEESRQPKCRYCSRRMSMLQKIEKMKSIKGSFFFGPHGKYTSMLNKQATRNRRCQTPASLFERAEMTFREMRSLAIILGLRSEKSLRTETFCKCVTNVWERDCRCGEEDKYVEWVWDDVQRGEATSLKEHGSLVVFHEDYSCGTTAIRGLRAMDKDQHFWEIKLTTPVYGTDMMIGVGTKHVELNKYHNTFCSMLGYDMDSWGISYDGRIQHAGKKWKYCSRFGQGTIIGIHLDMWHGTLTFFKNRQCLGVAFGGMRGRTLYPMACSTAARSGMRVISSCSFPSSLQFLCCQRLRQMIPSHLSVLDTLPMPPGLRSFLANNMAWLLHASNTRPPKIISSELICHICMPLKSALEGQADDEGSSDEERIDHISFRDSDDDTDEEDLDDFSDRSLQRHSLASYLIEASLRSRSNLSSSSSSSDLSAETSLRNVSSSGTASPYSYTLPIVPFRTSPLLPRDDSQRPVVTHSGPSGVKKARLDGCTTQTEEDNSSEYEEEEDESSDDVNLTDVLNLMEENEEKKHRCKLGKRKHI